ncbi:hypothetical protein COY05_04720 [Candidatus Peregrinibacteria bacterium CG_4_10_14_0_2_um_filter_38_24]|nr:MAG: hypothetical protein COY05_04720 [Candidatus Peregrinibacteria bacterium CG_4_10_14_0_2_um_filter_38_24]PJC39073.1 MAG: hypothetical protein CO044_01595 [Candidatus Peregrinibacteria bacterium CG_4_9_14_0_2_um_filter_38_9]
MQRFNCHRLITQTFVVATLLLTFPLTAFAAYTGDISINSKDIRFSSNSFMEGKTIRIYATVTNQSNLDLLGVVRFYANGNQIGGDQAISIFKHKTDDVFMDWTALNYGSVKIAVKIFPWEPEIDNPSNNWIVDYVDVTQDSDHDGIPNSEDPDMDGDGVINENDAFPLDPKEQYDTDGDGKGDNFDTDDDNDGVPDDLDGMPLDPNETLDTDKDGIGNNADTDDDGDKLSDAEELKTGTDPMNPDTDGDGMNDKTDAFPLDPKEQLDTDNDEIGNNTDPNDDNDSFPDVSDPFPLNNAPVPDVTNNNPTVNLSDKITLDASPSYDKDGDITSYLWEIIETPNTALDQSNPTAKEGKSVTYTFNKTGKYKVKLSVKDNSGEFSTKEFSVNIMNITAYKQIALTILSILLAMVIILKYITGTKNQKNHNS